LPKLGRGYLNRVKKTRCNCGFLYRFLCPKKFRHLIFMQIFVADQGNFCLVFAFSFISCYNSNVWPQFGMSQYNRLNVQSWLRNFKVGKASSERIRFLICDCNDFQVSKVLTSVMKFSCGYKNNYMRARVSFRRPFTPNSLFASMLPWTG